MLASQLNSEESRALISAVDRMREILHDEKINLPEIVVVGDQSVGKSSVLEAICGIQLPRAQNICTRCPLELRMKSTNDDEYAVIRSSKSSEANGKRINDLNQIADEVTRLTNEIAGKGANVSSDPIYLTVYKRNLPYDLTLIDLPGITRNPLPGQAKNIHEQILNLINKYIEPKTAVVLHVVPASVDFTTSESLKLAKQFDPEGERQLIAVSKIDKYDKGIAEKLLGEGAGTMKLQLGCVAVLNRNQDEIDNNISFEEMKQREKQFFIKHRAAFDLLPDTYKGVDQLVKKLAVIQNDRIRSTFPETVNKLREQLRLKQQELYNIPPTLNTEHECWARFQSMINQFRDKIHAKVNGDYDLKSRNKTNEIDITNLTKSKSISNVVKTDDRIAYHLYKFQKQFQQDIVHKFSNFFSTEYLKHVIKAIDDSTGVSLPNFPSFQIIEYLYHEELEKLPPICFLLLRTMCNYIRENLLNLVSQVFDNEYPRLIHRLNEVIREQITQAEQQAKIRIEEVLDMEYRLFTMNDEYMGMVDKVTTELNDAAQNKDNKSIPSKTPNNPPPAQPAASSSTIFSFASNIFSSSFSGTTDPILQSKEARAAPAIQIALDSYCKIVQKRLVDSVCQVCYYQFVTRCCLTLDQKLTVAVSSADLVRFMKEPAERAVRREKLSHTVKAYAEALKVGQEFL